MTDAEFIVEMQNRGYGTGLTATQWNQVAADTLRMYSRHRPRYILGTIGTSAGQEEYDLPAGGHICLDVAPYDAAYWGADIPDTELDAAAVEGDVIIEFHEPSLVDSYRQKLEARARQFGSQWEQLGPGAKVRLMPVPTGTETLAVLYTASHTDFATVPLGDLALLTMAGRAVALAALAVGGAVSVVASGGRLTLGPYTRDMGGVGSLVAAMFKQAEAYQKDFEDAAATFAAAQKG